MAPLQNLSVLDGWYYREFFDPSPLLSDEGGMGDVGDDLKDIYSDVCRGLMCFEVAPSAARWFWVDMHRMHWGAPRGGRLAGAAQRLRKMNAESEYAGAAALN